MIRRYLSSPWRLLLSAAILGGGGILLALFGAYQYLHPALPDVASIRDIQLQVPMRVYTRDGRLIAQFGEQRRIPLPYEAIPKQIVNAVLSAEDDGFFHHSGVDYPGLARATIRHLVSGEKSEGGSTITMQLTRGIFLSPEKSYRRKLLEIFLTLRIEQQFSKAEILTLYLNKMFLGQRAYGIGAAAEVYYGKSVDQLTLPEIAVIAGTFRLPSRDNPVANPELAKHRRAYVLRRMHENQFITDSEYQAALNAPVESKMHGPAVEVDAPYIAEMVRSDMLTRFGNKAYTAGYEVITTIDARLQASAVKSVRGALLEYDARHGYRGPLAHVSTSASAREKDWAQVLEEYPDRGGLQPALVLSVEEKEAVAWSRGHGRVNLPWTGLTWARTPLPDGGVGPALQRAADVLSPGDVIYVGQERSGNWRLVQVPEAQGAFVALDPQDGAISALVGGFDYFGSNFNRAVQARRQPGSSFKPFLYSAALDHGFTPATVINDAPLVIDDPTLEASWRPQNNSREFGGPMRLREALVKSRNLVSIRILHSLGPTYATKYAERFGFPENTLPRNLTLALGTAQVSPLEMATAYSVFANGGYRVENYYIQRISTPEGKVLFEADPRFVCQSCFDTPLPPIEDGDAPAAATTVASITPPAAAVTTPTDETRWGSISYLDEKKVAPRVISPQNSYLMSDIMADVVRRGTATRAMQLKRGDLAGKTGTSQEGRDTWFCGFNQSLVGTAWIGFDQEKSLGRGEEGARTALPMWIYFMADALQGTSEQKRVAPSGLVTMRVSADSGLAAPAGEPGGIFETFMAGHLPPQAEGGNPNAPEETRAEDSLF